MEEINIRRGESVDIAVASDDPLATTATLYVGKSGEAPILELQTTLTEGAGQFSVTSEQTTIAIDSYKYQININYPDGRVEKYPEPEDCGEDGLPNFIVHEALDSSSGRVGV